MKNTLKGLLISAAAMCSSALAADVVSESNLTGLSLPAGAVEVSDTKATTPFYQYVQDVADQMGGSCEYAEFLVWLGGDPTDLADQLATKIVAAGFKVKDLDTGNIDKTSTYEEFSMIGSKEQYAAVWVDSPENVVLGWCNVK